MGTGLNVRRKDESMKTTFCIYLATKTKWAHLTKTIDMPVVPRVDEHMKFTNAEMGDYFGFKVISVVYRESGEIEVMTDILNNVDERMYSFDDEGEFEEYYQSYLQENWVCEKGVQPSRRYIGT